MRPWPPDRTQTSSVLKAPLAVECLISRSLIAVGVRLCELPSPHQVRAAVHEAFRLGVAHCSGVFRGRPFVEDQSGINMKTLLVTFTALLATITVANDDVAVTADGEVAMEDLLWIELPLEVPSTEVMYDHRLAVDRLIDSETYIDLNDVDLETIILHARTDTSEPVEGSVRIFARHHSGEAVEVPYGRGDDFYRLVIDAPETGDRHSTDRSQRQEDLWVLDIDGGISVDKLVVVLRPRIAPEHDYETIATVPTTIYRDPHYSTHAYTSYGHSHGHSYYGLHSHVGALHHHDHSYHSDWWWPSIGFYFYERRSPYYAGYYRPRFGRPGFPRYRPRAPYPRTRPIAGDDPVIDNSPRGQLRRSRDDVDQQRQAAAGRVATQRPRPTQPSITTADTQTNSKTLALTPRQNPRQSPRQSPRTDQQRPRRSPPPLASTDSQPEATSSTRRNSGSSLRSTPSREVRSTRRDRASGRGPVTRPVVSSKEPARVPAVRAVTPTRPAARTPTRQAAPNSTQQAAPRQNSRQRAFTRTGRSKAVEPSRPSPRASESRRASSRQVSTRRASSQPAPRATTTRRSAPARRPAVQRQPQQNSRRTQPQREPTPPSESKMNGRFRR